VLSPELMQTFLPHSDVEATARSLDIGLFDPALLRSHRSALVRQDAQHYRPPLREAKAAERAALETARLKRRRTAAATRGEGREPRESPQLREVVTASMTDRNPS